MHAIRSQARTVAWKYRDDEGRNYNPFARTSRNSVPRANDEESLRHARTADDVPLHEETNRLNQNKQAFPPPRHSGTAPPGIEEYEQPPKLSNQSKLSNHSPDEINSNGSTLYSEKKDMANETQTTNDSGTTSDLPRSGSTTDSEHGPRKRKFFHFGKKDKEEDNELERTESAKRKKPKRHISWKVQLKATLFGSWINVLLICVPIGIALNYVDIPDNAKVSIFVVNFVAIIPLAAMLSYATEELAMYVGETLGGLLNASFGNATELIVGIIALAQKKILIVQTSLIGSMLSNLLLVLGMCFFFGGMNRVKQHFNITVAQTAASLLALSIGSLIIPTAFQRFGSGTDSPKTQAGVAPISRGTAIILLFVYGCYLFFQLKTHAGMYNEPSEKVAKRKTSKKEKGESLGAIARIAAGASATAGGHINQENLVQEPDDEEEVPTLSVIGALATLLISTVLVAICSECMVTGIDYISGSVSEEFIGLILLPIVGNAAEHATAVTVAIKDKMDLAIGVAVGSSMQIALLVLPLMVIISWCGLGQPDDMTLDFDGFQVAVLFIAVLLVNYLIQDGESHWLEGILLMATYIIIAVTAWFYPTAGDVAG